MSKKISLAAAAGIVVAFCAFEAQAVPFPAAPVGAAPEVTKVAEGCGPGFFRGRFGRCRPMMARRFRQGERCVIAHRPWGTKKVCRRY